MMSVAPKPGSSRPAERTHPDTSAPTGGIDWASDSHAIAVVAGDGTAFDRFTVAHTAAGLRGLCRRLQRAGVEQVGIERGDGPVVEALLAAGFTVLVIPPLAVKNLGGRYGSAGNKDDRFDAYLLADVVRTDRARLRPLTSTPRPRSPCARSAGPARTSSRTGSRWPTSCAPTWAWLPRRGRAVRRHRLEDQPEVPAPVPRPAARRLALAHPAGRLAARRRLLRAHQPRNPAPTADHGVARADRRRRRPRPDHPRPGRRARGHRRPDPGAGRPDRRTTRSAPRRRALHQPAPRRAGPCRPAARRDR
ncbi:transposase [Pseudonocardia lutea]|uniref:Transposase n=1 Tax=Pseudonocardia lutea TaxID=2172015 RepID=A0ABW1I8E1_9PSEU